MQRVRELRAIVGNVPVADLLLRASSAAQRRNLLDGMHVALDGEMTRREWGQLVSDCRDRHRGTIGIWQALYGGTRDQATLELARKFDLLAEYEYDELVVQMGLTDRYRSLVQRPWFDEAAGALWYGDIVVRDVDTARSLNTVAILRAFQAERWARSINPACAAKWTKPQLLDTVRCLNKALLLIRFHSSGKSISWVVSS